ncbi:hypothetical protein J7M23_03950, partial [Candidatus Sumerlaeota bacterium]|nr:hypothetical protein [Candidatus Sumerlaeota bacterium]
FLKVSINQNGTLNIFHKPSGKMFQGLGYFQDSGEVGNPWQHTSPMNDIVVTSLGSRAKISLVEDGRYSATFRVELEIEVPTEASADGTARSTYTSTIPICQYVTLKRASERVEIRTEINNTARDHWLRVVFPTGISTDHSFADSHFDIVKRDIPLPDTDTWKEPAVGTKPMRSFVDLNDGKAGLAVLVRGLQEYEVFDRAERPIAITLLRTFPINMEVSEAREQTLPDLGTQCLGKQVFEYAIYPHTGDTSSGGVPIQAMEFTVPVRAVQFAPSPDGTLPWQAGLFKSPPKNVIITAVKKAETDDKIVVRFFNPTEDEMVETLSFTPEIKEAFKLNLAEEEIEKIKVQKDNTIILKVPKKKIITLGLTL